MTASEHSFHAVAFAENLALRDIARAFPGGRVLPRELRAKAQSGGDLFVYPFGAIVFCDVPASARNAEIARLQDAAPPGLTKKVLVEELLVREVPSEAPHVRDGVLVVDALTEDRAAVVALTVAQSAAMEYYEALVDDIVARTMKLVARLEKAGTAPGRMKPLHRFIGEAITVRSEVLSVLHLLDKPDATWEDPAMDRIYSDLRAEFDLVDRYQAVEHEIRSVQEALELLLDAARDRRLVVLEASIVLLIVIEIVLSLTRGA